MGRRMLCRRRASQFASVRARRACPRSSACASAVRPRVSACEVLAPLRRRSPTHLVRMRARDGWGPGGGEGDALGEGVRSVVAQGRSRVGGSRPAHSA